MAKGRLSFDLHLMTKRDAYLRRVYGITEVQYNEILNSQGGGCGICGKTPEEEGKHLAVEHDHFTKIIRGLCCSYCNYRLLGRHRDPELLRRMARYLDTTTSFVVPTRSKKRTKRKAFAK